MFFPFFAFAHIVPNNLIMPTDTSPRFRTAHEAGKYIAAQSYPEGRLLTPHDYGAVDRYTKNPAWEAAQFEAVVNDDPNGSYIIDRLASEVKTSAEWYKEYASKGYIIVLASGWDDVANFYDFWNHAFISRSEFTRRLHNSTLDIYVK